MTTLRTIDTDAPEPTLELTVDTVGRGDPMGPVGPVGPSEPATSLGGARPRRQLPSIGRYRVTKILGEGGMGTVYAGYDDQLARPVALKLLRVGERSSNPGQLLRAKARLLREAQAMAQLSHPNVVQVYEVGSQASELFIAMQLIHGCDLAEWLERIGGAEQRGRRWPEVLAMFVQAGRGLAAAHAAGLVHRDFKPANVLVGDDDIARVLDFGLARSQQDEDDEPLDETGAARPKMLGTMTAVGSLLGTPAYFSPEQLGREPLDAASDQFSFCVSLHEGLFAARPFVGASLAELADSLTHGVRTTVPRNTPVPKWVQLAIDRGLAPTPSERWPSMDALLDALLDDPAIRRRRRIIVAVAGLLLAGGAGAAWANDAHERTQCEAAGDDIERTWSPDVRVRIASAFANSGNPDADATWSRLSPKLDVWAEAWRAARTEACLDGRAHADSRRAACLERQRWKFDSLVELLGTADRALVFEAATAVGELPAIAHCSDPAWLAAEPESDADNGDPAKHVRRELARVFVLEKLGRYDEALALADSSLARALELRDAVLEAEARTKLGGMLWRKGSYDAAEAELRRAYFLAGSLHHGQLAGAAAVELGFLVGERLARPKDGLEWLEHARMNIRSMGLDPERDPNSFVMRGEIEEQQGRYDEALAAHQTALALRRELLEPGHPDLADSLSNLGQVEHALGHDERALEHYAEALELGVVALGSGHPTIANIHDSVALSLWALGRTDEALAESQRALSIRTAALGPEDPINATTYNNLGAIAYARGDLDEAIAAFERALQITERTYGPSHPDVAPNLMSLAALESSRGSYDRAIEHQRRALELLTATLPPEHPDIIDGTRGLGYLLEHVGQYGQALVQHQQAFELHERTATVLDPAQTAAYLDDLGRVELALGDAKVALEHCKRAAELRTRALGPDHSGAADDLDHIGAAWLALGELDRALDHHQRALALRERDDQSPEARAGTLVGLAKVYAARARHQQALELLDESLALAERADALHQRALLLRARGREAEAIAALQRELELRERDHDEPTLIADAHMQLALLLGDQGREHAELARSTYLWIGERRAAALAELDSLLASQPPPSSVSNKRSVGLP